jgi:hypothetical protein
MHKLVFSRVFSLSLSYTHTHTHNSLMTALASQFGTCEEVSSGVLAVRVDDRDVRVSVSSMEVTGVDTDLRQAVWATVRRVHALTHAHAHAHHHHG